MKNEQFCQSCSMPLKHDLLGTEKDGSPSHDYCKFCYQHGQFTNPGISMDQMIEHMTGMMERKKIPEDILETAIARMPNLKRWKQQQKNRAL